MSFLSRAVPPIQCDPSQSDGEDYGGNEHYGTERHYAKRVKGRQDRLDSLVSSSWEKYVNQTAAAGVISTHRGPQVGKRTQSRNNAGWALCRHLTLNHSRNLARSRPAICCNSLEKRTRQTEEHLERIQKRVEVFCASQFGLSQYLSPL